MVIANRFLLAFWLLSGVNGHNLMDIANKVA
jgi:hypothetical protein